MGDSVTVEDILAAKKIFDEAPVPAPRYAFMGGKWFKLINGEWVEVKDINSAENFAE